MAVRTGDKLVPIYVGKTDRGFAKRLHTHSIFKKIGEHYPDKDVHLFLIARVTPKSGKFITMKRRVTLAGERGGVKKSTANTELEFLLIGSCLRANPALLNTQEKSFLDGLQVPGYFGTEAIPTSASEKLFSEMLNLK
jgi:hypothetical protein